MVKRKGKGAVILTSGVVVNVGLGKHSVILDLRLAEGGAVVADNDKLRLARSQGLEGGLVAEGVLARLHHQRKARVDGLGLRLFYFLVRHFGGLTLFSAYARATESQHGKVLSRAQNSEGARASARACGKLHRAAVLQARGVLCPRQHHRRMARVHTSFPSAYRSSKSEKHERSGN